MFASGIQAGRVSGIAADSPQEAFMTPSSSAADSEAQPDRYSTHEVRN
jgi:hypothetical protein